MGPKRSYLRIFGLQFIKNYYQIFNQHPRNCEKIKFHPKQKKIFLGSKCSIWFFGLEFCKTIVIFVINVLQFISWQGFVQKLEFLIWCQKCLIWVFWVEILKNHCHIWNQRPPICLIVSIGAKNKNSLIWDQKCQICLFWGSNLNILFSDTKSRASNLSNCKISKIMKIPKFGNKNASFGYFWTRIWKNYYHIWNQHPLSNCKISQKKHKCLNLGPKTPYLGTFGLEFEKTIVIFEISTLKVV